MNQRTEFVLRALKADNFRALCQEYGISAKTGYKWKERFLAEGFTGHVSKPIDVKSFCETVESYLLPPA